MCSYGATLDEAPLAVGVKEEVTTPLVAINIDHELGIIGDPLR
jgi:hypothetical protein